MKLLKAMCWLVLWTVMAVVVQVLFDVTQIQAVLGSGVALGTMALMERDR